MRMFVTAIALAAWASVASAQALTTGSAAAPSPAAGAGKLKRGGMCSYAIRKSVDQASADPQQWTYNKALFNCDHLGMVTVAQVYERGWRVVGVARNQPVQTSVDIAYAPALLIIEEQ